MTDTINVTPLTPSDRQWLADRTMHMWGAEIVVSRGRAHRVAELPGFMARIAGEPAGVATYQLSGLDCELVTIDALQPRRGVGTALLDAVKAVAGYRRLWLITTNDNIDAMRFYQRRGFILTGVYPGAISDSRKLKPQIPRIGNYDIPIRDEIEFTFVPDTRAP